jgi:hypothetical protein
MTRPDYEYCAKRGPALQHVNKLGLCEFCGASVDVRPLEERVASTRGGLVEAEPVMAAARDLIGPIAVQVRRRALERGQLAVRVVPVEGPEYRPGLDNPVRLEDRCPMFQMYPRAHQPSEDFLTCRFCHAPLDRMGA